MAAITRATMWKCVVRAGTACALAALCAAPFVVRIHRVIGASMEPTLSMGHIVFVETVSIHFFAPRRGEIIAMHNPHKKEEVLAKRVVGLPGERVHVRDNSVMVEHACKSAQCESVYTANTILGGGATGRNQLEADMFLGPMDYYVLGDNRQGSLDSRLFGAVQPSDFIGRVIWTL